MKTCSLCKEDKDLDQFHLDRRSRTGKASRCKACAKAWSKQWYRDSEKYRNSIRSGGLLHKYNITEDNYWILSKDQNNACAICKEKGNQKYLHVDHNHDTGEIRGLLCKNCNHGLGNFRDSTDLLDNAKIYLQR